MKVIDLMQMYVNKEVLPKKIIIHDYQLFDEDTIWEHKDNTFYCREYNGDTQFLFEYIVPEMLNDEVEILYDEQWKTIKDFDNYEISTLGNIRTKEYCDDRNHKRTSKLLKKRINNSGYEYVFLSNNNVKHKTLTIHRLVAKTFMEDYSEDLQVNHINGIKTDNRLENLEMVTPQENVLKRYEIGIDGNNYKSVEQYDMNDNYIRTYKSSYEAQDFTGINRTSIGACCRGERLSAGGYKWKFFIEDTFKHFGKEENQAVRNIIKKNSIPVKENYLDYYKDTPKEEIQVLSRWSPPRENKKIEKIDVSNFPKRNNSLKKTALKLNEIIDKVNGR